MGGFQNWDSVSAEFLIVCATQGDYVAEAAKAAGELYGYGHTNVLFKPTKAGVDLKGIIMYCSGFHFLIPYPYMTLYKPIQYIAVSILISIIPIQSPNI